MRIRILGSAAGGGLPQWNCNCPNCQRVRAGKNRAHRRTQSSVAISADGNSWFLLNVSADVRHQIIDFPQLGPPKTCSRGTSIAGCVLTDAELDHTSGLLQLREGGVIAIHSTAVVQRWLSEHFPIAPLLTHFADRPWSKIELHEPFRLSSPNNPDEGLEVCAFETGRDAPRYVSPEPVTAAGAVIGLSIRDHRTGGKLVYAPGVLEVDQSLRDAVDGADCLLMDGSFWSNDEPSQHGITDRTAGQMGHLCVGGPQGSLAWLAELPIQNRVYVHINNTNPMLNTDSWEYAEVRNQGIAVGADGDEFVC